LIVEMQCVVLELNVDKILKLVGRILILTYANTIIFLRPTSNVRTIFDHVIHVGCLIR